MYFHTNYRRLLRARISGMYLAEMQATVRTSHVPGSKTAAASRTGCLTGRWIVHGVNVAHIMLMQACGRDMFPLKYRDDVVNIRPPDTQKNICPATTLAAGLAVTGYQRRKTFPFKKSLDLLDFQDRTFPDIN